MVVRFLPPPAEEPRILPDSDRENLAEVIQMRRRLNPHGESQREQAFFAENTTDSVSEDDSVAAASSMRTASDDAVRMLARRARSSGELRRELLAVGHEPVEVDSVVIECEDRLYLDDLGLARVLSETLRLRKRASRSQVRMKLRDRLLPDGVIEEVLSELDDDEENELLREAAVERARKMGALDRQTAERRLLGFLARRGWSGERAVRVAREALDRDAKRSHSVLSSVSKLPPSAHGSVRFH